MLLVCIGVATGAAAQGVVADAVMNGNKAALRALLQQKADVNAPQTDGATALHWAVYRDDLEAADLLIRAGSNVKAANRTGATPLAMASLYGHTAMIEKLLKAGNRDVHEVSKSTTLPIAREIVETYVMDPMKLPWYIDLLNINLGNHGLAEAKRRIALLADAFRADGTRITANLDF